MEEDCHHGVSNRHNPTVSVIGMSCRAPKSDSIEEFWRNLMGKVDMISQSTNRWPVKLYNLPSRIGLVNDITKLDADFFSVTADQASHMDPQLRMLMEVATEAIFDSGVDPKILTSKSTGVYTAVLKSEVQALGNNIEVCSTAMFPSRLSKFFGFNGPSLVIDCACSSALVAVSVAVTDLLYGRAEFALVAGCSLLLSPNQSVQNVKLGMLSDDGTCRTWDESASGYVRSEGIYCILLARDDVVDLPRTYADVISVGNSSDGFKNEGITFPSNQAQKELLKNVYSLSRANISINVYNECHATGTQAGDPEEADALAEMLREKDEYKTLLVGSCKSNLGHAEWAAGLASFIKAVLCIHNKVIAPNIHLNKINSKISSIVNGTLVPVTEPTKLPDGNVGVSAMGFGGSNCHVVLKPPSSKTPAKFANELLVLLGSRTEAGLPELLKRVAKEQSCPATLSHISRAFAFGNKMNHRCAVILSKHQDCYSKVEFQQTSHLANFNGTTTKGVWLVIHDVAVVQYDSQEDDGYKELVSHWLMDEEHSETLIEEAWQYQLVRNAACILSTINALKDCEINISGVIGAGISEVIAGVVDQCFNKAQAVKILAVIAGTLKSPDNLKEIKSLEVFGNIDQIYQFGDGIQVISYNHPKCFKISGRVEVIKRIKPALEIEGLLCKDLVLVHPSVYTSNVQTWHADLTAKLKSVMIPPLRRSRNWIPTTVATTYSKNYLNLECVNAEYISNIVHSPTYLMGAVAQVPAGVQQIHIGSGQRPLWLKDADVYINSTQRIGLLSALGELYLKGFFVNISKLQQIGALPAGSSSIGHLIQWNHTASWPVPHWLQFCSSIAEETNGHTQNVTWDGTLGALLCSIWKQIQLILPVAKQSVGLHSLTPFHITTSTSQLCNIVIQVFTGSQRFIARKGNTILLQGEYSTKSTQSTLKQKVSGPEIAQARYICTWPVKWVGNWMLYIQSIIECLKMYSEEESNKTLTILSVKFSNISPKSQEVPMSYEPKTGLCECEGVSLVTSPVKSAQLETSFNANETPQAYPFASSNITTPVPPEEATLGTISIILTPSSDNSVNTPTSRDPTEQQTEVHAVKLYRLKRELCTDQVLVYCGCIGKRHVFGMNLLNDSDVTCLIKPMPVPQEISCAIIVGILVPYLLAHSVFQSSLNGYPHEMDRTFIVAAIKSDPMLRCVLAMLTSVAKNVYVCIKDTVAEEMLIPQMGITCSVNQTTCQNTSSKSAPATLVAGLKSETVTTSTPTDCQEGIFKQFKTSTPDNQMPPASSSVNETRTETFNECMLSKSSVLINQTSEELTNLKSPVKNLAFQMAMISNNITSNTTTTAEFSDASTAKTRTVDLPNWMQTLTAPQNSISAIKSPISNITIMKWGVNTAAAIQKATKAQGVSNIISMESELSQWTDLLKVDGHLVHIGRTQIQDKLGIGLCSQFGSVMFLNPSIALQKATLHMQFYTSLVASSGGSESFGEDTNTCLNPSLSEMATVLSRIRLIDLNAPEKTIMYECSGSVIFLFPVSLPIVHKHIQKMSNEIGSEEIPLQTYDWLGKLQHFSSTKSTFISASRKYKRINFCLNRSVVRPHTPVPRVYSITPAMEKLELNRSIGHLVEDDAAESRSHTSEFPESAPSALYAIKVAAPLSRPSMPTILSMNDVVFGHPVVIVHPITGVLNMLRHLGSKLPYPCYGIQQTAAAPTTSLSVLAKFYLENCKEIQGVFPLQLIGYSYGACIALSMALEAQSQGFEVHKLIMLDGSPQYITEPLHIIRQSYSVGKVEQVMETEMLLAFLQLYGEVDTSTTRPALLQAASTQDRINVAVKFLEYGRGMSVISPWRKAARLVMDNKQPQMYSTIGALMFNQRASKAKAFLDNMELADKWIQNTKYKGDVHLFRTNSQPTHCPSLPEDYGIQKHVTGNVCISKYEANHESIVGPKNSFQLIQDIVAVLNC